MIWCSAYEDGTLLERMGWGTILCTHHPLPHLAPADSHSNASRVFGDEHCRRQAQKTCSKECKAG